MGGEGTHRVFGQNEAYDPQKDGCVAGGGAVMGGDVQSAVHEAFTLG